MLLIGLQIILQTELFFQCIADCIQTTVSGSDRYLLHTILQYMDFCNDTVMLLEVCFCYLERAGDTFKFLLEDLKDFRRFEFLMHMIGNILGRIAHCLTHLGRQIQTKVLLQNITDTALTGLAVDPDHICLVLSSDILRIQRQIRNGPFSGMLMLLPDLHTLGDCILMRTGEGCKYQRTAIGASHIDIHARILLIFCTDLRHIRKIQPRIHALGIHIHSQCYDIYISGTLSVSEKGSFNTVCSGKYSHLRIADAAAAVIMRMKRNDHIVSVF